MRSMGDPGYVYRPWTELQRQRASEAQRRRLGIPDGHRRVWGVDVPEEHHRLLVKIAARLRYTHGVPERLVTATIFELAEFFAREVALAEGIEPPTFSSVD